MRDTERWKPCKVCGNHPTFGEGPICEVCGFLTSGEFHRTQDVYKIPNSEISMPSELAAKTAKFLLAKRKIDSQDMNAAPSKKPCNGYGNYPTVRQGTTSEECSYSTFADQTQDVSKIPSSGISMPSELNTLNSLLTKRKIVSQDMNGAPSKKPNAQDTRVKHLN